MTSLEKLMDYDAVYPVEWEGEDALLRQEIDRLVFDFSAALCVWTIPRRLGIYATREETSGDKNLGKKFANVALRALQWHGEDERWMHKQNAIRRVRENGDAYMEAAQRLWVPWYYDRLIWIEQRIPVIACWAIKTGRRVEGNQFCSRLRSEKILSEQVWWKAAPPAWREPDDTGPGNLRHI